MLSTVASDVGPAPPPGTSASYETFGLTRSFPGVLAVDEVSIAVRRGEIHGVIGKNGAGKTVLMSTIAGIFPATAGHMTIGDDDVDMTHHSPGRAHALGIALIPQEPLFAKDLSVIENVFMGRIPRGRFGLVDFSAARGAIADICGRMGITIDPDQPINSLDIEHQQFLALGRALYVDRARVLLLDEITASLSRARKQVLGQTLKRAIAERPEISVTLITHHIDEVLEFCDRVTVMRDGHAVRTIDVSTTTKTVLASWIVGSENADPGAAQPAAVHDESEQAAAPSGEPVLTASSLGVGERLDDLSFELHRGEVLGIAGLDGSGKDELFAVLAGLRRPDRGSVGVAGKPVEMRTPADARALGIAYLPKKRDQYAILPGRPVDENALALVYPQLTDRYRVIDSARATGLVADGIASLRIKTPSQKTEIQELSGGNRQKTMIVRIVSSDPTIYLLNEPTRGVDLATKPELLATIRSRLAERGAVIVTTESEEELVSICDRVLVLYRGKVVGDHARGTRGFTAAELYRLLQGVST